MSRIHRILITTAIATGVLAPNALAGPFSPKAVITTSATPKTCGTGALCTGYVTSPGVRVGFHGAFSDPGPLSDNIKKVEFDLNGNGVYDFTTTDPNLPNAYWTYEAPARDLVIKMRVTNTAGYTDEASIPLRVNTPPQAKLDVSPGARAGEPFTVDASGSTDDMGGLEYAFDVEGDGTYDAFSSDAKRTVRVDTPGPHSVGVKVRDAYGSTQQMARVVDVRNAVPSVTIAGSPAKLAGSTVRLVLSCPAAASRCDGDLALAGAGAARFAIAAGATQPVDVRVNKKTRKRIKRLGSVTTTAKATATDAEGNLQVTTATVTLTR